MTHESIDIGSVVAWRGVNGLEYGTVEKVDGDLLTVRCDNGKHMIIHKYNIRCRIK